MHGYNATQTFIEERLGPHRNEPSLMVASGWLPPALAGITGDNAIGTKTHDVPAGKTHAIISDACNTHSIINNFLNRNAHS